MTLAVCVDTWRDLRALCGSNPADGDQARASLRRYEALISDRVERLGLMTLAANDHAPILKLLAGCRAIRTLRSCLASRPINKLCGMISPHSYVGWRPFRRSGDGNPCPGEWLRIHHLSDDRWSRAPMVLTELHPERVLILDFGSKSPSSSSTYSRAGSTAKSFPTMSARNASRPFSRPPSSPGGPASLWRGAPRA